MDIVQYLIELLKTHKQIGIEGLGTLYKKKTPGRYDAATHSFLPPSYTLEFTADVLEHTNLVEYIHSKRKISEDSARYFISQFVTDLEKALKNGDYEIPNLGTFSVQGDELKFTPAPDIDTGFDFFALPAVTALMPDQSDQAAQSNEVETTGAKQDTAPKEEAKSEISQSDETEGGTVEEKNTGFKPEAESANGEEVSSTNAVENQAISLPTDRSITTETEVTADANTEEKISEETYVLPEQDSSNIENTAVQEQTWNFEDDDVVTREDIDKEEHRKNDHTTDRSIENEKHIASNTLAKEEELPDIKLKSTTHQWDFNNIEKKTTIEDNTLIGEFDDENFEDDVVEEKVKTPVYQKIGFGLVALLVLFVILYFVKPDIFKNFQRDTTNPDEKLAVPIERNNLKTQKDSISFADSIMKNAAEVGIEVQPAKDTVKVTTQKKEIAATYTYDVIIASFASEAKAQDYISRLKKKGFDAKISAMHGKRKNISIATYNNIDSAQKYVSKFRKQFNNEDIYAQPIKNK